MSPKDLIIDFINVVFLIVLVAFTVFYFIAGDRFGVFIEIMKSLAPLSFFAIMFLAVMKIRRSQLKRAKKQGEENTQIIIRLTIFDRMKADAVAFIMPVIVLGIAFFFGRNNRFFRYYSGDYSFFHCLFLE